MRNVGKPSRFLGIVMVAIILIFNTILGYASPSKLSFQARIIKPNGKPLISSGVSFRFTVTDHLGTCVIYQEDHNSVNMADSNGNVTISVGSGTQSYPSTALTLSEVFDNNNTGYNCKSGGTYFSGATDSRKLAVQFNDGSGWQTISGMDVNSVPFAMQSTSALKLGAYDASEYLRTSTLPSCVGGQALHYNGSSFTCVTASGGGGGSGTVTSVSSTNPFVSVATSTTTPVITIARASGTQDGFLASSDYSSFNSKLGTTTAHSGDVTGTYNNLVLNNVVTAGTSTKVTFDAKGRIVSSSSLNSSDITTALGYTPVSAAGTGSVTQVSSTNPFVSVATSTTTPVITIAQASSTQDGFLSSSDWSIFNTKLGTSSSFSGDVTGTYNNLVLNNTGVTSGTYTKVSVDAKGRVTASSSLNSSDITTALGFTPVSSTNVGTVIQVSSTNPFVSVATSTTTPVITIAQASSTQDGFLSSTDWSIFNSKQDALGFTPANVVSAVLISTNHSGDVTGTYNNLVLNNVVSSGTATKVTFDTKGRIISSSSLNSSDITTALGFTPVSSTNAGTVTQVSSTNPFVSVATSTTTPVITIAQASSTQDGFLSSTDWSVFNSKQDALGFTPASAGQLANYLPLTGGSLSGNLNLQSNKLLNVKNVAGTSLDPTASEDGKTLRWNNTSGQWEWFTAGAAGAGIASINGASGTAQTLQVGSSGSDFAIDTSGSIHTFNIPTATSSARGLLSSSDWSIFNNKLGTATNFSGDVTGTYNNLVLNNTGVTSGTYTKVSVDAKGRVTASSSLNSSDITSALGFTPVSSTNTGTVTQVSSTNPFVSVATSTTTPVITIAQASSTQDGYLSSTDWSIFNSKQDALGFTPVNVASAVLITTNHSGDVTGTYNNLVLNNVVSSGTATKVTFDTKGRIISSASLSSSDITSALGFTPVSSTNAGTVTQVSSTNPFVSVATSTTTPVITIARASGTQDGFLASTDWSTFDNKLNNSLGNGLFWIGNASGVVQARLMSGDATMNNSGVLTLVNTGVTSGTYTKVSVDAKGRVTASSSLNSSDITSALGFAPVSSTNAGTVTQVSSTNPFVSVATSTTTPVITIAQASSTQDGFLSSTDWSVFNSKQDALGFTPASAGQLANYLPLTGGSLSGNLNLQNNKLLNVKNVAGTSLDPTASEDGKTLRWNNTSSQWEWFTAGAAGAGIASINGASGTAQTLQVGSSGSDFAIDTSGSIHTFNIPTATSSARGLLSSSDWSIFNNKLGTASSFSGDVTGTYNNLVLNNVVTSGTATKVTFDTKGRIISSSSLNSSDITSALGFTPVSSTNAGTVTQVSSTNPFVSVATSTTTPVITIARASGTQDGFLASTDWSIFNSKQDALGFTPVNVASAVLNGGQVGVVNLGSTNLSNVSVLTNGVPRLTVSASGDVGIGSLAPAFKLDISDVGNGDGLRIRNTSGSAIVRLYSESGNHGILKVADSNGTTRSQVAAWDDNYFMDDVGIGDSSPEASLEVVGTFMVGATAGGNGDRLIVNSSGQVGIATSAPERLLHVAGPMRLEAGSLPSSPESGDIAIDSSDSNKLKWYNGSSWQSAGGSAGSSGTVTQVSSANPFVSIATSTTTPVITIAQASSTQDGFLSSNDWSMFNTKLGASSSFSGDVTGTYNNLVLNNVVTSGTATKVTFDTKGRIVSSSSLSSSDITTALGFTPSNATSAVINGGQTGSVILGSTDSNEVRFLTNNEARLTISTNGYVGVGTSTPWSPLSVYAEKSVSDNSFQLADFSSVITATSAGVSSWGSAFSTKASSTLGLNNISGGWSAGIQGGAGNINNLVGFWVGNWNSIAASSAGTVTNSYALWVEQQKTDYGNVQNNVGVQIEQVSGAASGNYAIRYSYTPSPFVVTGEGKVGIGTTTPNRLLDVAGPIRIQATSLPSSPASGDIAIDAGDSNKLKWYNGSSWQSAGGSGGSSSGTVTQVSSTNPFVSVATSTTTPVITIARASGTQDGFLASTDWSIFNNKQNALGFTPANVASAVLITTAHSGDVTGTYNNLVLNNVVTSGTATKVTFDTKGRIISSSSLSSSDITTALGFTPSNNASAVLNGGQTGAVSLGSTNANNVSILTNNLARLTILASGDVGIGTTATSGTLTVSGTIYSSSGGIKFPDGTIQTTSAVGGANNSIITNFPDAIKCNTTTFNETVLYYANFSGGNHYYIATYGTVNNYYVSYTASGAYNATAGLGTVSGCNTNISTLYTNGRAFNFTKGPAAQWLSGAASSAYYNAGNVGVGTPSPGQKLSVAGRIETQGGLFMNQGSAATDNLIYLGSTSAGPVDASLGFFAGGIGSTGSSDGAYFLARGNTFSGIGNQRGNIYFSAGQPSSATTAEGSIRFHTGADSPRLIIDKDGNVGIGTTTPSQKLTVSGTIESTAGGFKFPDGSIQTTAVTSSGSSGTVTQVSSTNPFVSVATSTTTPVITIARASGTQDGFLASTDWSIFNAKLGTTTAHSGDVTGTYNNLVLNNTGVTSNTYSRVSVDAKGRVTAGMNPTTLAGFGITDAVINGGQAAAVSLGSTNSNNVSILTNNSPRMTVDANGYIGMGTTAPNGQLVVSGTTQLGAYLATGWSVSTADTRIELGGLRTDVGNSYIDFHSASGTDYSFRVIRYPGVNGTVSLEQTGTGAVSIVTSGTSRLSVLNGGEVGISRTPAAGVKLDVQGQIRGTSYNAGSSTSIDWNNGNVQYTSANCTDFVFSNMLDGGTYTLIVTGTTSGTCRFSQSSPDTIASGTFKFAPANAANTASSITTYTFLRYGSSVVVSWITGFQ